MRNKLQRKNKKLIQSMVEASHRLGELGYVSSSGGNLSYRISDDEILITPTKTPKRTIKFNDICIVDINGKVKYAKKGSKPTGELPFHLRIFKMRKNINAIAHAHPPILTGFSMIEEDILSKPFLPENVIEVGPIYRVKYAVPLSEELSKNFDCVIEKSNGFLMNNHGALFCSGTGIFDAVEQMQMSENMALSVTVAKSLGGCTMLSEKDTVDLDNVLKIRNLHMPGEGQASAKELFFPSEKV